MKRAILHFRRHNGKTGALKNNGGLTVAVAKYPEGYVISAASCSDSDMYNKKVGRLIATGRLDCPRIRHSTFDKDTVVAILHRYTKRFREEYTPEFFQRLLGNMDDATQ